MALAGIEFLLRSHGSSDLHPDHSIDKVLTSHTGLDDELRNRISKIFSSKELNIRNRCLHGSFLEVEGRRDDTIRSSGILENLDVSTTDISEDGSTPESIYARVLDVLQTLATHLNSSNSRSEPSWTNHFLLAEDEKEFASKIKCDFLESVDSANAYLNPIKQLLLTIAPSLSTPVKMGIISWVNCNKDPEKHIAAFHLLALLFEPLLRLVLHLCDQRILQISTNSDKQLFRMQYLMLDNIGLLSSDNIEFLTSHIDESERQNAQEILRLSAKVRDAFAHGAVTNIN